MAKRDVYIAIMVASARGQSLTLRPAELDQLSMDDAIERRALNSLEEGEARDVIDRGDNAWAEINPRKKRDSANFAIVD